jgi:hypothetical protein
MPVYDQTANQGMSLFGDQKPASRSYVLLVDDTGRVTKEDIALFPGPISEIGEVPPGGAGRHFRVAVEHPPGKFWWESLRFSTSDNTDPRSNGRQYSWTIGPARPDQPPPD